MGINGITGTNYEARTTVYKVGKDGTQRFGRGFVGTEAQELPSFVGKVYTKEELLQSVDKEVQSNQDKKKSLYGMIKDSYMEGTRAKFRFVGENVNNSVANEKPQEIDFDRFAPNAPDEVKQAFMEAASETGYYEYNGHEKMGHIS